MKEKRNGIKSAKKMLGLLRHDRHKKIRVALAEAVTKNKRAGRITFCHRRRHYVLKKDNLKKNWTRLSRRKYLISSYLYNVVCKFPRKYGTWFLGQEVLRKYYSLPAAPSKTRFIAAKVIREHYRTLSRNTLTALALRERRGQVGKKWIIGIEERLDSNILRLLNFSPQSINKQATSKKKKALLSKSFLSQRPKYNNYKVKLPITGYGALYTRQLINHGHIRVDGKKERKGARKMKAMENKIEYNRNHLLYASNEIKCTILLRSINKEQVKEYIRGIKVKRYTEIYYMIYRNLHWIERSSFSNQAETHLLPLLSRLAFSQSVYHLWPLLPLLHVKAWGPTSLRNLLHSISPEFTPVIDKTKMKHLLRWKRLFPAVKGNARIGIVQQLNSWTNGQGNYIKNAKKAIYGAQNYALIAYGTRKCKWVKIQQVQNGKGGFYRNQIFRKANFFELELEFFQWIHQAYLK